MKTRTIVLLSGAALVLSLISLWMGQQAYTWFPPQASVEAQLIDRLFSVLVTLGTFIFLGVFSALSYSVLFQRAGKYDTSDGPPIEGNVTVEIVWTLIPIVLVIWIAGYSYQIYGQMSIVGPMEHAHGQKNSLGIGAVAAALQDTATTATTDQTAPPIEVYARQWVWEFRYPDQNVTSTELHLPNQQRAKLVLRSEDVLHGFYVPAFRVKQDMIPGRVIDFEFTPTQEGRYRLRDSQYSGTYFAAMQTDVVVESAEAYQQWLAEAAARPPVVAYNRAFDEYNRDHNPVSTGWQIVKPASPPLVNAPASSETNPPSGTKE
jgi:cytochrome c oxidase subunit II